MQNQTEDEYDIEYEEIEVEDGSEEYDRYLQNNQNAVDAARECRLIDIDEERDEFLGTLSQTILGRLNKPPSKILGDLLYCLKGLGDTMKKKYGAHALFQVTVF